MGESRGRKKNIQRNIVSGFLQKIVVLAFPFVVRSLLIHRLGIEYVGLDSLFVSILTMLSLTELGFASAVTYSLYKPVAENNRDLICCLLGFYRKIYRIIGGVVFCLGIGLMPFLKDFVRSDLPADINLYVLYSVFLLDSVASYFLYAYKTSLLVALQRDDLNNKIAAVTRVLMYIVQIALLYYVANYYLYIIWIPVTTILSNLLKARISLKKYPEYRCCGQLDKVFRYDIYKRVGALIGHKIGSVATISVSNIVISSYLGLTALGMFNNYYYIINILAGIFLILNNAIIASVGNSIASETVEKNYGDFKKVSFCYLWLVGWSVTSLVCLYQPFMKMWVGRSLMLPFHTALLMVVLFYIWRSRDLILLYKDAAGMWWYDRYKPYVAVAVNLGLNLLLVRDWGINGAVLAVIAGFLLVDFPWSVYVLFRYYFHLRQSYWYKSFAVFSGFIAGVAFICYYLCSSVETGGVSGFIIKLCICLVFPNFMYILFSYRRNEFLFVKNYINGIVRRRL